MFLLFQYGLTLPLGFYYGITKEKGVKAFLIAQLCFQISFTIGNLIILLRQDWGQCAEDSQKRLDKVNSENDDDYERAN